MILNSDNPTSMDRPDCPVLARPPEWQPLVSPAQWAVLARALGDVPELLDDLRVVLAELSPGVRGTLIANVMGAFEAGLPPGRAVWAALAMTDRQVRLGSAVALGRLHALGDGRPLGEVRRLPQRR